MLNFGTSYNDITAKTGGGGRPAEAGYTVKILNVIDAPSKAGNPMLRIDVDIAEGDYANYFEKNPLRVYQTYHTDEGRSRLKSILETAKKENPANITDADFTDTGFNEQKLVGCTLGAAIAEDAKGYLSVLWLTDKASAAKWVPKQKAKPVANNADDSDLPF